jgi:signal transduction histidine kinase
MLKFTRLFMLIFISIIYYSVVPQHAFYVKLFVAAAIVWFIISHVLIMVSPYGKQLFFILMTMDFLAIAAFGFFFPFSTLYLILFGVEAVTVFLYTDKKKILFFFSTLFACLWISITIYAYVKTGVVKVEDNILNFMFIVFEALVGGLIRKLMQARLKVNEQYSKLQESHNALKDAHEQLHMYAKEVESLTEIRERNRIARDIHDTVGHNMTALLVQLQLTQELFKQGSLQAERTLQTCTELARSSLQEIRLSVRTLKEEGAEDYTLVSVIRTILEEFAKATGVEISFQLKGDPMVIPVSLHPTIARAVQESLTNAKRHGGAKACEVHLECTDQKVVITISDDGKGTEHVVPGFGLINMKERIEEHGGAIAFTSKEGHGFQIQAEFPIQEKKWIIGGAI